MTHDAHLREKAIRLRTEQHMTLDDIVERLKLPKTTIYYWIKDFPIQRITRKGKERTEAQRRGTEKMQAKYAALREEAYQQGWDEAPELLKDLTFRDFVVLYMAEGYKRNRNEVSFGNSDARMMILAHRWIKTITRNKIGYQIQYHIDHDEKELKQYWADLLGVQPEVIKTIRKSNSGQLKGRNFRSEHGVLTVRTGDTYFRMRLQAWMEYVKNQW